MQNGHDEMTLVKEQTIISSWLRLSERLMLFLTCTNFILIVLVRIDFVDNTIIRVLIHEFGSFTGIVILVLAIVYVWFYRKINKAT